MPQLRRTSRPFRGYDDQDIAHILHNKGYFSRFGIDDGRKGNFDQQAFAAAWEELRDELLPQYIADYPGERPFAWWAIDAPEPRKQIISST